MLFAVLGLPAVLIIITTRKVIYCAWMIVYLLSLPVWNLLLPVYAYWHFDDFSWGETRKVQGEGKSGGDHGSSEGYFDVRTIPMMQGEEWEKQRLRAGSSHVTLASQPPSWPYPQPPLPLGHQSTTNSTVTSLQSDYNVQTRRHW